MLMDASALVDLFVISANTERIRRHLEAQDDMPIVSDFAAGEFASAVKRYFLMGELSESEAVAAFGRFDAWSASNADQVATEPGDVRLAAAQVRRLDIKLGMPDAMYLAVAHRLRVPLCSFDADQTVAARRLGIDVATID